jgi:hypothetical protein
MINRHAASRRIARVFLLPVLAGVVAMAACTAGTRASAGATGGTTGGTGATVGTGGIASAGGRGAATGGSSATGGSTSRPEPDGGSVDAACARLAIGILGSPGSNPSSNFQSWLEARGTTVQRIQTTTDVPLTSAALAAFDVVILDLLPRDYTPDEAMIFAAWVSAGGGFAAMSGYEDDTTQDWRANSLLAPLGLAYAMPRSWGPVTQFATHPITAGLTSVTFTGGYPISDVGGSSSTRTPIAFLSGNPDKLVVGYAVQMNAGRGFVWGDEWIEFDSEWSAMPQIPRLWLQVFNWISPPNRCMLTGIGPIGAVWPAGL